MPPEGEDAGAGAEGAGSFIGGEGAGAGAGDGAGSAQGAGGEGAGAAPWQDSLPDDIKTEATFTKFKEANDGHRAYFELEKKMGGSADQFIKRPGENPTPEVLAVFHTALGRPETAEGYQFPKMDGGDLEVDGEYAKDLRNALFAAGLSSVQATSIYTALINADTAQATRIENSGFEEISGKLTQEWGTEFAAKKTLAERALATFPEQTRSLLKVSGLNNDPGFVSQMAVYGATMAEHGAPGGGDGGIVGNPEDARRAYNTFIRNSENQEIMRKPSHQDYRQKSEEYSALVQAMGQREA